MGGALAPPQAPPEQQQAADPMTRLLQWGVDNTDQGAPRHFAPVLCTGRAHARTLNLNAFCAAGTLAERAKAVREGRAEPMKLDKEVMDAMFGGKVKFLQVVVQRYLYDDIRRAIVSGHHQGI